MGWDVGSWQATHHLYQFQDNLPIYNIHKECYITVNQKWTLKFKLYKPSSKHGVACACMCTVSVHVCMCMCVCVCVCVWACVEMF